MKKNWIALLVVAIALVGCAKDDPAGPSLGSITGRTINARTLQPLPSVYITTIPPSVSILSDASGVYTIPELVSGTYVIMGRYSDSATGQATANVLEGKTVQADVLLSFAPATTGSVIGVVKNESGEVVVGASVYTTPATSSAVTDNNGSYLLVGLQPGDYKITATSGALSGQTLARIVAEQTTEANLTVRTQDLLKGWVYGTVVHNGAPVTGAQVSIAGGAGAVTTGSDGAFYFGNVLPGNALVTAVYNGATRTQTAVIAPGIGTSVTFEFGFPTDLSTDNLIAYYPLNGSGADISASGFNGEVVSASFTNDRNGRPQSALVTTGSIDAGVIVPHHEEMNVLPVTLSAWIRIDDPQMRDCLILGKNVHPDGNGYYLMLENQELIFVYIQNFFTRGFRIDRTVADGEWLHVAMTVSSGNGTAYINGAKYDMPSFGASAIRVTTQGEFRMGSHQVSDNVRTGFRGAIDDVFIYGRVLSDAEIADLKNISF